MNWFKKQIAGNKHFEYRISKDDINNFFFDIELYKDGTVRLYDLRDMPPTYYLFDNVKFAQRMAVESINNPEVLKPYLDVKWYEQSEKTAEVMEKAQKLLDSLKEDKKNVS